MADPHSNDQEAIDKVRDLIQDIDIAMLTTVAEDGLVSRPMKTQKRQVRRQPVVSTKKDTGKFHEMLRNRQVNVAYAGNSFVSIRGEAELVDDKAKIKELWNPGYEMLLETGYDDP